MAEEEDDQLMWLEEDAEEDVAKQDAPEVAKMNEGDMEDTIRGLEAELARSRKELQDVRKDLAAKTVQLSKKEHAAVAVKAAEIEEKAAEIAASATSDRDRALMLATEQVLRLEMSLSAKEEEVEESRRLYAAQKKALREALNAVAEREANERANDEANHFAQAQAVEDEFDKLQYELVLTRKRAEVELKARDTELRQLKEDLGAATANRQQAVANSEAALIEAYQQEMESMQASSSTQAEELQGELLRVRAEIEDLRRADASMSLTGELAMLNNQKVQIQREFEVYKDVTIQASRTNREEVAKLLSEVAELRSRLAAKALDSMMLLPSGSAQAEAGGGKAHPKMFDSLAMESESLYKQGLESCLPQLMSRIERQRKGLLPALIIGSLVSLILLVAIIRAAASARSQHSGGLCFLAKLGIRIGTGCDTGLLSGSKGLAEIMDKPQRVHDVVNQEEVLLPVGGSDEVSEIAVAVLSNASSATASAVKTAVRSGRRMLARALNKYK